MSQSIERVHYVDSHTAGEPTRVIDAGGPDLGSGPLAERVRRLRDMDWFRRFIILEPRGWDAMVGALICPPCDGRCAAGVIFMNNAGYLGMCGHGAIGVGVTLYHLGLIGLGKHMLETPVGTVAFELSDSNQVSIDNVVSYRLHHGVSIDVEGLGALRGDVAWGGNWFFLADGSPFPLLSRNAGLLSDAALKVRQALARNGITGDDGAEIDHIEFFGPGIAPDANSRNFVLCPGGAYDRSPCGTGTSAKLACLAADKKLLPGETWIQESIIGSRFEGHYRYQDADRIVPTITGRAFVCSEGDLIRQCDDPLRNGIAEDLT